MPILTKEMAEAALAEHERLRDSVSGKYQVKEYGEQDFGQVTMRIIDYVAKAACGLYSDAAIERIMEALLDGDMIPAGSILTGLGNDTRASSLSNCYYTPIEGDSLEHIFGTLGKLARIYSYRGGSGSDFTVLRPKAMAVNNAAISSTGSVSFIPLYSKATGCIGQNGRRGAFIGLLDIRHPDALDFIWCKANPKKVFGEDALTAETPNVHNANLSLKITDAFMNAVVKDQEWRFVYPAMDLISGSIDGDDVIVLPKEVFKALDPKEGDWVLWNGKAYRVKAGFAWGNIHLEGKPWVDYKGGPVLFKYARQADNLGQEICADTAKVCKDVYNKLWDGLYDKWTDEYLQPLVHHSSMPAREVLYQIAQAAHAIGDPGVLFMDAGIDDNPVAAIDPKLKPTGCNPCGEQIIPSNSNCLLTAVNMAKFVRSPWTPLADFDVDRFIQVVKSSAYFLDLMVDENIGRHPLQAQREMDAYSRRIGIEPTGVADALAMLGYVYGSSEAIEYLQTLMQIKARAEIEASAELARLRGPATPFNNEDNTVKFLNTDYVKRLEFSYETIAFIQDHGLRNCSWGTAGPCGSISIIGGNVSSGIEPIFRFSYTRRTRLGGNGDAYELIHRPALEHAMANPDKFYGRDLEDIRVELNYIEADCISPTQRIKMQQAVQRYTDAGVSSTINLPSDATVEDIVEIYTQAWLHRLKGITVFRDGCKAGVYSTKESTKPEAPTPTPTPTTLQSQAFNTVPIERELLDIESSYRHRVTWYNAKLYVIVSVDDEENPLEIFAKLPREVGINGNGIYHEALYQEKTGLWDTICRLTSLLLRVGMPVERVIKQLDKSSYSLVDAAGIIARILRQYVREVDEDATDEEIIEQELGSSCPSCKVKAFIHENGCGICKSCGFTTCG